jgi:transketolase
MGKVIFVAGHSGPETADDSRTHFGIFSPGVTRLFPKGSVINLHPWEYNEVPVLLGAALKTEVPILALHLTRPPISIPDRKAIGMPSHFEAAKGAYIARDADPSKPRGGTVFVQGTSAMGGIVEILDDIAAMNLKVVCVCSSELFARQSAEYRDSVVTAQDRVDSTVITTQARDQMQDWLFNSVAADYALSSDWDNRWRTGGTLEEVLDEAGLSPEKISIGLKRFADERKDRLARLESDMKSVTF